MYRELALALSYHKAVNDFIAIILLLYATINRGYQKSLEGVICLVHGRVHLSPAAADPIKRPLVYIVLPRRSVQHFTCRRTLKVAAAPAMNVISKYHLSYYALE